MNNFRIKRFDLDNIIPLKMPPISFAAVTLEIC